MIFLAKSAKQITENLSKVLRESVREYFLKNIQLACLKNSNEFLQNNFLEIKFKVSC